MEFLLVFSVNLIQPCVTWEDGASTEELPWLYRLENISHGDCLIQSLIWKAPGHCRHYKTVSWVWLRKGDGMHHLFKVSSTVPALTSLCDWLWTGSVRNINSLALKLLLVKMLNAATKKWKRIQVCGIKWRCAPVSSVNFQHFNKSVHSGLKSQVFYLELKVLGKMIKNFWHLSVQRYFTCHLRSISVQSKIGKVECVLK